MKRIIAIFSVLVLTSLFNQVSAQNDYKVYCEVNMLWNFKGCYAALTLGDKYSNVNSKYDYIGDSLGDKKVFRNSVSILNYMSKNGWDIEYKVTNADSISCGSYLLSKYVQDDAQITSGLTLAKRNKSKN